MPVTEVLPARDIQSSVLLSSGHPMLFHSELTLPTEADKELPKLNITRLHQKSETVDRPVPEGTSSNLQVWPLDLFRTVSIQ
jgi:hypothetical protein